MILTALLTISLQLFQPAQSPIASPDFSGNWKMDKTLTTWGGTSDLDDLTLEISQNQTAIHIKRIVIEKKHKPRIRELTYYPDGRGEKISLVLADQKWPAKTQWVNDSLVTKFTVTQYERMTSDFYYFDYQETWTLSGDGKQLTISTEVTARNVPAYLREVFTSTSYRKVFRLIS